MNKILTKKDVEFILESLNYTKLKFENYEKYPNPEFKQQRINDVIDVIGKVQQIKKALNS